MLCKGNCKRVLKICQEERGFCDECYARGKRHNEEYHKHLDIVTCLHCFKEGGITVEFEQTTRKYLCRLCGATWEEPIINESPSITRIKEGV